MRKIRKPSPRHAAPIVAAALILSVAGIGVAQGSPDPSATVARGKKKVYALDANWKTGPLDVIGEGERGTDLEGTDEAKLEGRPFGKGKALLDESYRLDYNHPDEIPRMDYSGDYEISFDADVIRRGKFRGTFSGFYDYSVDSEGNPSTIPTGRITGGTRELKGATGTFTIQNFHVTSSDPVKYAGHWRGSIRY